jgi:trehalose 6-phosphate phosphatase
MTRPVREYAYFLDIDGTLIDFAEAPGRVTLDRALPGLVESLYQTSGGAVALITGRSIADVDRLFPARRLPAAGQHGLERRSADGRVTRGAGDSRTLDGARPILTDLVRRHPRLLFEDKGQSLALHYRRAPRLAGLAHRVMRSILRTLDDRYCVHGGKRVVELAPAGRDKGAAIGAFMREAPFRGRTPLFIGDDVTDEYGFAMVNRLGGYAIKVGPGRTSARWRLANVWAVLAWLDHGKPTPRRSGHRRKT